MSQFISFFKIKSKVTSKDYKYMLNLFIISLISSFTLSNVIVTYLGNELYFNIFNAISIQYWLLWLLIGILHIALIRTILISIFTMFIFSKAYYLEIFMHIVKYAFLIIPIYVIMILIVGNHLFIENFISEVKLFKLNILAVLSIVLYLLIWIYFLGTSTKFFFNRKYSKFTGFIINIIISFLTTIILGLSLFSLYEININKHEESIKRELLESVDNQYKLTNECKQQIINI